VHFSDEITFAVDHTKGKVMTGDGWSDSVARPIMEVFPYAWIFFIIFILISTFVILNLFIAVIVDASNDEAEAKARAERDGLRMRLAKLNAIGKAYVSFAVTHPGHFRTMFRVDTHNSEDPELTTSGNKAFEILSQAIDHSSLAAPLGLGCETREGWWCREKR
jgi:hypothetical protein